MSIETKNTYGVTVTNCYKHHYEVNAESAEEAKDIATARFVNDDSEHYIDHAVFIEEEEVVLLEDEPATNVIDACS